MKNQYPVDLLTTPCLERTGPWPAGVAGWFSGALMLMLLVLAGCASPGDVPPPQLENKAIPSPQEVLTELGTKLPPRQLEPMVKLEPVAATRTSFPYEGKLFSLSVRDTPLGDVLLVLANEASLNLVMDQGVDQKLPVSIEFTNIPLKAALDNLMAVYDYAYNIDKGVLHVSALQEEVFHIDYPLVFNKPSSEVGGDVFGGGGGGGGDSSSDTVSLAQDQDIKGEFKIKVELEDAAHLNIWKQLENALKPSKRDARGLLSKDGMVQINRMGGIVYVRDHPSHLKQIRKFISNIQNSLRRQVVIEAKIIEVTLNKGHQYGINWEHVRFNFARSGGVLESSANLGPLGSSGAFTLHFADFVGMDQGEAFLHALGTNGEVNILSAPRLNVLNNQSAYINVGRVVPFVDYKIGQSAIPSGSTAIATVDSVPVIARFNEGVTLGITPQINEDGDTVLHIVPIVTEQSGSRAIDIRQNGKPIDIPIISVRESDTMVRVQDRSTIVLGGLISEKTQDTIKKVPLLGDIPAVGWAFSHQNRQHRKTELVIMLTTTVVMR